MVPLGLARPDHRYVRKPPNAPVPLCASFIPLLLDGVLLAEIVGRLDQVGDFVQVRFSSAGSEARFVELRV